MAALEGIPAVDIDAEGVYKVGTITGLVGNRRREKSVLPTTGMKEHWQHARKREDWALLQTAACAHFLRGTPAVCVDRGIR